MSIVSISLWIWKLQVFISRCDQRYCDATNFRVRHEAEMHFSRSQTRTSAIDFHPKVPHHVKAWVRGDEDLRSLANNVEDFDDTLACRGNFPVSQSSSQRVFRYPITLKGWKFVIKFSWKFLIVQEGDFINVGNIDTYLAICLADCSDPDRVTIKSNRPKPSAKLEAHNGKQLAPKEFKVQILDGKRTRNAPVKTEKSEPQFEARPFVNDLRKVSYEYIFRYF